MVDLSRLNDEQLLNMRFRDLGLQIEGTWLEKHISQLYDELTEKNIGFHPSCFLADEWLSHKGQTVLPAC